MWAFKKDFSFSVVVEKYRSILIKRFVTTLIIEETIQGNFPTKWTDSFVSVGLLCLMRQKDPLCIFRWVPCVKNCVLSKQKISQELHNFEAQFSYQSLSDPFLVLCVIKLKSSNKVISSMMGLCESMEP